MMDKKTIFFGVLSILLIGIGLMMMVSGAVQTLGVFEQRQNINLVQVGAGFENCTILSVLNPNSVQLLTDTVMNKSGNYYNTSFSQTEQLGSYVVNGFCSTTSADTVWAYDFEITETGEKTNVFPFQFAILILGLAMAIVGTSMEHLKLLKYSGGALTFVMGVLTIFPGYAGISGNTLLGLTLGTIAIGFGFYTMIGDSLSYSKQEDTYNQDNDYGEFKP